MSVTFVTRTADEYRAEARRCREASAASWERSDTDGFLSQWANDSIARQYDLLANLAENGGKAEFQALFLLDGRIASTDRRDGQYGPYWILNDEAAEVYGKRFLNESKANKASVRNANHAKKGFTIGTIRTEVVVVSGGNSFSVSYYPIPKNGADIEIISATGGDTVDYLIVRMAG